MTVAPFAEIKEDIDLSTPRFESETDAAAHGKDLAELDDLRNTIKHLERELYKVKQRKNQVLDTIESRILNLAVSIFKSR